MLFWEDESQRNAYDHSGENRENTAAAAATNIMQNIPVILAYNDCLGPKMEMVRVVR